MWRYIKQKDYSGYLRYRGVRRPRPAGTTCDQPRTTPWVNWMRSLRLEPMVADDSCA